MPCLRRSLALTVLLGGCVDDDPRDTAASGTAVASTGEPDPDTTTGATDDGVGTTEAGTSSGTDAEDDATTDTGPAPDMGPQPPTEPPMEQLPCEMGSCWDTLTFSGICGPTSIVENFSSGNYNVHQFALAVRGGTGATLTLTRTGGSLAPALVIHDERGATIYDGEIGLWDDRIVVEAIDTGEASDTAVVHLQPTVDMALTVFATGWTAVDGGFAPPLPTDVTYAFEVFHECEVLTGAVTPPNFDPGDVVGGYHVLPESEPPGLYNKKHDDCSRGIERLIEVIYAANSRYDQVRPGFTPLEIRDLNEAWCSTVDHATHDDGTHADITGGCTTSTSCGDFVPAMDFARLLVDTGEVCGILFNDTTVQDAINPYFEATQGFAPWNGTFMRSVSGHDSHFHVRVRKPDGTCN